MRHLSVTYRTDAPEELCQPLSIFSSELLIVYEANDTPIHVSLGNIYCLFIGSSFTVYIAVDFLIKKPYGRTQA